MGLTISPKCMTIHAIAFVQNINERFWKCNEALREVISKIRAK